MAKTIDVGEELMPHRRSPNIAAGNSQAAAGRGSQSQAHPTFRLI